MSNFTSIQRHFEFSLAELAVQVVLGHHRQYIAAGVDTLRHVVRQRPPQFKVPTVDAVFNLVPLQKGNYIVRHPLTVLVAECHKNVVFELSVTRFSCKTNVVGSLILGKIVDPRYIDALHLFLDI